MDVYMSKKIRNIHFIFALVTTIILVSCSNKATKQDAVENTTLLIFGENKLINVNLDNNTIKWVYDASADGNENKNYLAVSDSIVYAPFENGNVIAFNINNGDKRWGYNLKDYANYTNSLSDGISITADEEDEKYFNSLLLATQPTIVDDKLILSTGSLSTLFSGKTFALNKENGKVEWIAPLPNPYNNYAPVVVNKNLYINSVTDILKINMQTGLERDDNDNLLIGYKFESPIYNQMYSENNLLYFFDEEGILSCLDLTKDNNGLENIFKWQSVLTKNGSIAISPKKMIIDENNIYLAAFIYTSKKIPDLYFYKIDKTSGNIENQIEMPKESSINDFIDLGSAILVDNNQNLALFSKKDLKVDSIFTIPENMKIISNLIQFDNNTIIYLTNKGLVKLNLESNNFTLIELPFQFGDSYHFQNINSILLLNKSI